jgi:alpha-L-fucosidase
MIAAGTAPSWRQLRRRPTPEWWSAAQLGIFIHWTPASVPGFAPIDVDLVALRRTHPAPQSELPYAEWYENSLRFPDSSVARFHRATYGDRTYESFAADFEAGLAGWDPHEWADLFARAGARYVVLVTKHHDGYCLWPSDVPNPHRPGWHTHRDVVGELADAVRAVGLRFGTYYSGGLDWTFDDRPLATPAEVFASVPPDPTYRDYAEAQVRELIDRYRPDVLWNDIAWPFGGARLRRLFADYYRAVPDGIVNDRWMPRTALWALLRLRIARRAFDAAARRMEERADGGIVPPRPPHFGFRTPEYTTFEHTPPDPWEACRGIDRSFGYNRASTPAHHIGRDELLTLLRSVNAAGGNLLLNVGPRGDDATIPDDQRRRLRWLAEADGAGHSGPPRG